MIFVMDSHGQSAAGNDIKNALEVYYSEYGDDVILDLKFFEGTEFELEFVVKPKVKKVK